MYRNDYVTVEELREAFRAAADGTVHLKYRRTTNENAIGDPGTAGELIVRNGRRIPDRDLGSGGQDGLLKILEALDADEEQRNAALKSPQPVRIIAELTKNGEFQIRRIWT